MLLLVLLQLTDLVAMNFNTDSDCTQQQNFHPFANIALEINKNEEQISGATAKYIEITGNVSGTDEPVFLHKIKWNIVEFPFAIVIVCVSARKFALCLMKNFRKKSSSEKSMETAPNTASYLTIVKMELALCLCS